jgi:hypothetical protein
MGFNKRYLSERGIRSYAKSNVDSFHWFERYMVGADAYIIESEPEDFASKFYAEGNGGEIGDGIGDEKIKKVKTLPPNLVKNDDKRLGGGTRDHTFSAFMEKQKVKTKENADYKFTDLMKHQQTGE